MLLKLQLRFSPFVLYLGELVQSLPREPVPNWLREDLGEVVKHRKSIIYILLHNLGLMDLLIWILVKSDWNFPDPFECIVVSEN